MIRQAAPLFLPLSISVFLCASWGCQLTSQDVLEELDRIEKQRESGSSFKRATGVARGLEFADVVRSRSQEVVTQAYMMAGSEHRRKDVIALAAYGNRGSGRYVPLLCYALQFDVNPDVRMKAAQGLALPERVSDAVNKSGVVMLLGTAAVNEEVPYRAEHLWYYLEEFLIKACDYEIPGATRAASKMPLGPPGGTLQVVRSDPRVVRSWWVEYGDAMARSGAFDRR
jgi:hypothetical protein